MSISEDIDIADEITAALNAGAFGLPFVAERVYAADWDLKSELSDLQVGVWPAESAAEAFERELLDKSYRIGVSFAQRIAKMVRDDVDALMHLVKSVQEFLELTLVTIPDGRQYLNQGWEYVLRFNDAFLDRHKDAAGDVTYTGLFASILVFDFQSLE